LESSVNLYDKIDSLVKSMFPTGKLKVNIEVEPSANELSSDLQLAIYRILQEQLANILKHADATLLLIVVKREGKFLEVIVKDNGKGFDPVLVRQGIGLENIRRRAQAHDGSVVINSAPGNGVELIVKIPFAAV
jgi:signal transduction histidine kinase